MESLCLHGGRIFTAGAHKEFERSYLVFRCALNRLATKAFDDKVLRYHFRPKLHQLGHLVYHFLPKNPRYLSCYQDEDYVSRTKTLAEKCHPLYVSQQTCFRYAVRMSLEWSGYISNDGWKKCVTANQTQWENMYIDIWNFTYEKYFCRSIDGFVYI